MHHAILIIVSQIFENKTVKSTLLLFLAHHYRYYELSSKQMRFYRLNFNYSISDNQKIIIRES